MLRFLTSSHRDLSVIGLGLFHLLLPEMLHMQQALAVQHDLVLPVPLHPHHQRLKLDRNLHLVLLHTINDLDFLLSNTPLGRR